MKKTLLAIGFCLIGSIAFSQNQPDSIHIVLHENQNGTIRMLDTIVPMSQMPALHQWMEANSWQAPPPPPPVPGGPEMFQQEIIIEGDSGAMPGGNQRVMMYHMEGDSLRHPGGHPQMIMITMDGDSMPPPPPGCRMKVAGGPGQPGEGDVMIMRTPMPPHPPGSTVEVNFQHKDTIINGVKHEMIIRTEKIILPEGVSAPLAPPAPPMPPKAPIAPQQPKQPMPAEHQKQLVVYPNPASSVLNVEFDVNANEKTTLRVIDAGGKVVYEESIKESESKHVTREINLTGKSKGAYTVEVKSDRKVIAETVIVQ